MTATASSGLATHELVLHTGAAELVDLMVPFVREGVDAGDQVVVMGKPAFVTALLSAAPPVPTMRVLTEADGDRQPARDLHRFQRMLDELAGTVPGVRVVNQMPAMTPDRWLEWRRYEAAVNVVVGPYPVWGKCGYDARELDAGMVSDLRTSHPFVQTPGGRRRSPEFEHLGTRSRTYLDVPDHPVEATEPALVMTGATAAEARRAVRELAARSGLPATAQESVILATNEAVINASLHGRPPVLLRVWVDDDARMTVAVSDGGPGPHPLVGMVPGADDGWSAGGMWIVHLLLPLIHHRRTDDGYTVTFAVDDATAVPDPVR